MLIFDPRKPEQCKFSSLDVNDKKQAKQLVNALSGASEQTKTSVKENANVTIGLKDVFIDVITKAVKDDSGNAVVDNDGYEQMETTPRIVMFDDKGKHYVTSSKNVLSTLSNIFTLYGEPNTWEEPLKITFSTTNVAGGRGMSCISIA